MTSAFIVLNPVAGNGGSRAKPAVERHLAGAGWTYEIYETTGEEQIDDVVRRRLQDNDEDVDLCVAAGGDGTVSGVAGGLAQTGIPLGILPLGTANTFARELGIPLQTKAALKLLTEDHALVEVDAMAAEERLFLLNVSIGLSGLMIRDTDRMDKRRLGRAAYVWTGFRKLFGYEPHQFLLTVDGDERLVNASEIAIVNSGALGDPSLRWTTRVELNDGRIDVCVMHARSLLDYLSLAAAVALRRQAEEPGIDHYIAERRVVVKTESDLPVQADGEELGKPPVEVSVMAGAVRVVVPQRTGGRGTDPEASLSEGT